MKQRIRLLQTMLAAAFLLTACSKKIKQQQDEIYSRHLQAHIKLTIISTPLPDDKSEMNLLLLNDGQDVDRLKVKDAVTELYQKDLIQPLLVVGIHAANRDKIYGVAGYPDYLGRGSKADQYADFIDNELYAFVKKRAGVRKFKSVIIAGNTLGGLSAFDIAWNHADKMDKVGVFAGSFTYRNKSVESPDYADNTDRILFNQIKASRKKPHLQYWFYGDSPEEDGMRYRDSITVNNTKDLAELIKNKNVCPAGDIVVTESGKGKQDYENWSKVFPDFLIWAVGR